jgi:hypothetical protein
MPSATAIGTAGLSVSFGIACVPTHQNIDAANARLSPTRGQLTRLRQRSTATRRRTWVLFKILPLDQMEFRIGGLEENPPYVAEK